MIQCDYDGILVRDGLLSPRLHAMMGSDRFGMDTDINGMGMERYSDRPDTSGSLRRWEITSLRARDGQIVGSYRDITGPYPYILGKKYGVGVDWARRSSN
jgi:hypothetical protein